MKLAIELTADQEAALRERAERHGLRPEELARAALSDLLARPEDRFEDALREVLSKNDELYRRLS